MKQITVISGKGGTGKTSLVAAFGQLAKNVVLADCDVDAANLHLIIKPISYRQEPELVRSGFEMVLDAEYCTLCGECEPVCRFDAVHILPLPEKQGQLLPVFDPLACEGCGCCADICPTEAIGIRDKEIGYLFRSNTRFGPMVHARLNIAESNSGKLVTLVRNNAKEYAEKENRQWLLIDGSPGIGCPVIASLTGVDFALIVTEATESGRHDFLRILELCAHFKIKSFTIVNKFDLNEDVTEKIKSDAKKRGVEILGTIPFNPLFVEAMVQEQTILEYAPRDKSAQILRDLWEKLKTRIT
ncbi:4Fe-4S binding protein [candidate division CSSED10-310 bacterium]|uniref:4Fe-4S binding protein n=1 Tax=candidate division CSSED10-310 bacterium TaxID=2855610 RepID=A0ABV6YY03_UNCC1